MPVTRFLLCAMLVFGLNYAEISLAQTETTGTSTEALTIPDLPDASDPATTADEMVLLAVPMTASDLSELASVWQGHVRSALEELARLNLAVANLDGEAEAQVRTLITDEIDRQGYFLDTYRAVLDAWARKGAAPEEIEPHQRYIAALSVDAIRTTDFGTLFAIARDWVLSADGGLGLLVKIGGFLIAIWVLSFVARFARRAVNRGLARAPHLSRLLQSFVAMSVYWAVFMLGVIVVLGVFGVNVTPLFAVFGGLSFILGFALQETLGNLASGLMIMVLRPFDTGDYIEIGGSSGFVDDMSIVSTKIRTFDNQIIVVPNSKIWGDVITNVSASPERRVDLVFGIGYGDDAHKAIDLLWRLVKAHPQCLETPEAAIFVGELGDSSVNIFCRPWCKSDDYWTVYWDLTGQAKEIFDAEGISIPFPQRDVHLIPATPDSATA